MTNKSDKKEKKVKEHDSSKYVETEPTIDEQRAVLSVAQRRAKARAMKKNKFKVRRGKERSLKKKASKEVLTKRAKKKAIELVKDKLAGKKSYKELSPAEKVQVDKRAVKVPATRVDSLARRMMPKVRKKEQERISARRTKKESFELKDLIDMVENIDANTLAESYLASKSEFFVEEQLQYVREAHVKGGFTRPVDVYSTMIVEKYGFGDANQISSLYRQQYLQENLLKKVLGIKSDSEIEAELRKINPAALQKWVNSISPRSARRVLDNDTYKKYQKAVKILGLTEQADQEQYVTRKQLKAFESVVDKLFKTFDIDFEFTKHFHDRINDARNDPGITLKDLSVTFKKLYAALKKDGNTIQKHENAEAVLKDIQQDLNLPIAVEYDRKNDELDVIMKTVMRKKNFRTPNDVIKV